jgi:hypothetical protein
VGREGIGTVPIGGLSEGSDVSSVESGAGRGVASLLPLLRSMPSRTLR